MKKTRHVLYYSEQRQQQRCRLFMLKGINRRSRVCARLKRILQVANGKKSVSEWDILQRSSGLVLLQIL